MRSSAGALPWMGSAFVLAAMLAGLCVSLSGTGEHGIVVGLIATARLAFLFFWPAYTGRALVTLFGAAFEPLARRARELGLAFASVEIVHLGLVAGLCLIGRAPSLATFVFFGIAVFWVACLVLMSIGPVRRACGPRCWWLVRVIGLNYIAYAFYVDFMRHPLGGGVKHVVEYLPFAALAIAGPGLRLAAYGRGLMSAASVEGGEPAGRRA